MAALMRLLCCCVANESDDQERLIVESHGDRFRNMGSSDSADHFWVGNASTASANSSAVIPTFKPGDEEDELLNQILETAQQNIIDVANIDGTATPCKEDVTKAQWYADTVKQHDLLVRKRGSAIVDVDESHSILIDVGARALDTLQQTVNSSLSVAELREYAKELNDAIIRGIQVEHKQDILVHMSFTDD